MIRVVVEFLDGRTQLVPKEQIAAYVTEADNPGNEQACLGRGAGSLAPP